MKVLDIGNFRIGKNHPVFIIAEAGVNHNGDIRLAKKLCDVAKEAGANAVKFQTWKTEQLITRSVQTAEYQKITTKENSQYKLLKNLELSFKNFREISQYCNKIGIMFLSTPGDTESLEFLNSLNMDAFKIGSDDMDNLPLIKHTAEKRKPVLISTGMSTMKEVKETLNFTKKFNDKIILLHCTSNYPADIKDINMKAVSSIKNKLHVLTGYSDHTTNIWIPLVAVCLGCTVIEKHLTLDHNLPGPDHKSSLQINDFMQMVKLIRKLEKNIPKKPLPYNKIPNFVRSILEKDISDEIIIALGSGIKRPTESEKIIMPLVKKTIVALTDIKKGEILTEKNITIKRAGEVFLKPREFYNIINRKTRVPIKQDEVINYEKIT